MIGRTVKHYSIEGELGRGGMGVVYRARDERLQRPVALKFLPAEFTEDAERKRRFLQEARAACAVNHPSIAQVYDVDEGEEGVYIAMELIEGRTLRSLIGARELDLLGALEVAIQVAGGLGRAHDAGIVHRDIKAENIMVTPDGHAKILDFGLAKLLDGGAGAGDPAAPSLSDRETALRTRMGVVVGTLQYMSPEQARGQAVDPRSDIFSLGVVLYEMVTGQPPFQGETALDTLHAIAFEETRPVTALRSNLPPSLQRVVARCLRKRREDRYPHAEALAEELKLVRREVESGVSHPYSLLERVAERLRELRTLRTRDWVWPVLGTAAAVFVLVQLLAVRKIQTSSLVVLSIAGLYAYRFIRNRPYRLMKGFAARVGRIGEVRYLFFDGRQATVVVDQAPAGTYVRLSALMDRVNAQLFFGDTFRLVVRDNVPDEELKLLMTSARTLFVRRDLLARSLQQQ
jgi:predicted Ser/Thr protein kinase